MRSGLLTAVLVVLASMLVVAGCATDKPPAPSAALASPPTRPEPRPGWPDTWGITFGLRCASAGEDVRFCTCLANLVQQTWTPDEFEARGPDGIQDGVRVCREHVHAGEVR